MNKKKLMGLFLGIVVFISLIIPAIIIYQSDEPIASLQKSFVNHYGGTSEAELQYILQKQKIDSFSVINFLKYTIRQAVHQNIAPTTILILFCLPLIGTLDDVLHYMIGLKGYGIFMPTMIAAAFWSTGIVGGLILFLSILILSLITRRSLYKIKLHYWPRRSITLSVVVIGMFIFLNLAAKFIIIDPSHVTAFTVLFLILLSEAHISIQRRKSPRDAIRRTLTTLFLAIVATLFLSWYPFQRLVLLQPELFMLFVLAIGITVGRYTGFRLLEYSRFSSAIRKEEEE